jgi:hypothetical protein
MMTVVEEIYLGPLRIAQEKAEKGYEGGGSFELQLLGERIAMCSAKIDEI